MSDTTMSIPSGRVPRPKKAKRPNITIDGNQWMALENFATRIGVSLSQADRMNFPRVEIGGAIYVNASQGLREIAAQAKRRYGWPDGK